jgi:endonuclease/exonuclease/phosphatase family metal-dependent hydrolase
MKFLLLIFATLVLNAACHTPVPDKVAVAFYNCENLFDTIDDPRHNDSEFTPAGVYLYTSHLYNERLHNLAVVVRSFEFELEQSPVLMALAEVENSQVLTDLLLQPELARKPYKFIITDGPDPRGINQALLYDTSICSLISWRSMPCCPVEGCTIACQRDILFARMLLAGDTVDVFVNHWPSRRGSGNNSALRFHAATGLQQQIVQDMAGRVAPRLLVMGDYNDNPADSSMNSLLTLPNAQRLLNPYMQHWNAGRGTEYFKSGWNLFDQILLSDGYASGQGWCFDSALIYAPAFLGWKDGRPRRAFKGTIWARGYSDHFPVLVFLSKK